MIESWAPFCDHMHVSCFSLFLAIFSFLFGRTYSSSVLLLDTCSITFSRTMTVDMFWCKWSSGRSPSWWVRHVFIGYLWCSPAAYLSFLGLSPFSHHPFPLELVYLLEPQVPESRHSQFTATTTPSYRSQPFPLATEHNKTKNQHHHTTAKRVKTRPEDVDAYPESYYPDQRKEAESGPGDGLYTPYAGRWQ